MTPSSAHASQTATSIWSHCHNGRRLPTPETSPALNTEESLPLSRVQARPVLLVRLGYFRVLEREYLRREERRIPRSRLSYRHRRNRNPSGICTIASSASSPSRSLPGSGTPIIGSVVQLAITPGRCAAIPAPAIITSSPRSPRRYPVLSGLLRCPVR